MSIPLRPNDVNGFLHRASSVINRFNRVDPTTPLVNDLQGFIKRTKAIKEDLKKIEVQLLQGQETNKLMTGACTVGTVVGAVMCFIPVTAPVGLVMTSVSGTLGLGTKVANSGNNYLKAKTIKETLTKDNYDQAMIQVIEELGLTTFDLENFRENRDKCPFDFTDFFEEIGKGIAFAVDLCKDQKLLNDAKLVCETLGKCSEQLVQRATLSGATLCFVVAAAIGSVLNCYKVWTTENPELVKTQKLIAMLDELMWLLCAALHDRNTRN